MKSGISDSLFRHSRQLLLGCATHSTCSSSQKYVIPYGQLLKNTQQFSLNFACAFFRWFIQHPTATKEICILRFQNLLPIKMSNNGTYLKT